MASNHTKIMGGVNLANARLTDAQAQEAQEQMELHVLGRRCNGCGRRVGIGIRFTSIDVRDRAPIVQMVACDRPECDFAERAREGATFMEVFEVVWLDSMGVDAPAVPEGRRMPQR